MRNMTFGEMVVKTTVFGLLFPGPGCLLLLRSVLLPAVKLLLLLAANAANLNPICTCKQVHAHSREYVRIGRKENKD
jgi:hypothetical protein